MAIPACTWGCRLAVPLEGEGWVASMDDVRVLVDMVHHRLNVEHPMDDYFLNLLGTARLTGRVAADLKHMQGDIVVLGAYKIRQPHHEALQAIARESEGDCRPPLKLLAQLARELGKPRLRNCRDALTPSVRGGTWCWSNAGAGGREAVAQEERAWEHFGATTRDHSEELTAACEQLARMEDLHGGDDPLKWKWGAGTPCADVHEADTAKWEYEDLEAKIAALVPSTSSVSSASQGVVCTRGETSERVHSRSPRR